MRISDWSSDGCSSDLQVVAAHAWLAGDAGRGDDHVRAGDVGIFVGSGDLRVKAFDRAALAKVQRLALRDAFDDVEQDDVAQFLDRRQMSERPADVACADERDLLASHKTSLSYQLRSEEHTSELQSLMRISYAVFCLKKKKTTK